MKRDRRNYLIVMSILALPLCACSKGDKGSGAIGNAAAATAEPSASEAKLVFKSKCSVCHGENGTGDGPGAAALNPKPRNFTEAAWQTQVQDDEIRKAILEGGSAVGKSPAMAPNPDLKSKPKVVDELIKIVRGFKQ